MLVRAWLRALLVFSVVLCGTIGAQLFPVPVIPTPDLFETATGDLNGDGRLDLVAAPTITFTLRVFVSDGALGFVQLPDVPTPVRQLLAVGDITGDGAADVLAETTAGELLYVFPGNGGGGLGSPLTFPMGQRLASAFVVDVNEDGHADVFGNRNSSPPCLVMLFGDGAGGLSAPVTVPLPSAGFMDIADLDADGHLDAVTGRSLSGQMYAQVVLGDGRGGFSAPVLYPLCPSGLGGLTLGDWNSDGHVDVAAVHNGSGDDDDLLAVAFGDGLGAFGPPVVSWLSTDEIWQGIDAHDVDADGHPDLLVGAFYGRAYMLLRNDGLGSFAAPVYALPAGEALSFGQLDGDGIADAAIVLRKYPIASGGLAIVAGLAGGGFAAPAWYDASPYNGQGLAIADLDGDGHLDALCGASTHSGDDSVAVLPGDGNGAFGPVTFVPLPTPTRHLAVGDLNEDGWPDIVTSNETSDAVMVLLADGAGGFGAPIPQAAGQSPQDLALADLDGDGDLDLVVADDFTGAIRVWHGDGAGGLTGFLLMQVGSPATELDVADVDHDLVPDVAVATEAGVVFLRGDGAGGFEPFVMLPTNGEVPGGICIGDVHLDGHPDLVTSNLNGTASVLPGDGLGGFGPAATIPVGNGSDAYSIAVGDVTGDGWPDLVVPRDEQDRVFVLQGNGTGAFVLESAGYVIGDAPSPVVLADVNEDGRPDVVSGLFRAIGVMPSIGQPFTWKDLGHGLSGTAGAPDLAGHGTMATGSSVSLSLVNARPLSPAFLIVSPFKLSAPFKGGVLVPFPSIVLTLGTSAAGGLSVSGTVGALVPPHFTFYFQYWVMDPGGPAGLAASNAISATTP